MDESSDEPIVVGDSDSGVDLTIAKKLMLSHKFDALYGLAPFTSGIQSFCSKYNVIILWQIFIMTESDLVNIG